MAGFKAAMLRGNADGVTSSNRIFLHCNSENIRLKKT